MCTFKGSINPDKTLIMADFDRILIDFSEVWTCLAETEPFRELSLTLNVSIATAVHEHCISTLVDFQLQAILVLLKVNGIEISLRVIASSS